VKLSHAASFATPEIETPLPPPTWDTTNGHAYGRGLRLLFSKLGELARYYVACKGNRVAYLRSLGVRVGDNCEILTAVGNFGTEPWLIEIGNRVTLAQGVILLTHDGANRVFRHRLSNSSPWGNRFAPVRVLDNSFVGAYAILMPGVTVGPHSIVGVGSVVNKDIPAYTVAAGVPAVPICTVDEYIERYKTKMVPITAANRAELRDELTRHFWGEPR